MLDAVRNCKKPLIDERLFDWHAALFPFGRSGMHRIIVADWRKGEEPMQVVSGAFGHEKVHYEAPASEDVSAEMARLIEWSTLLISHRSSWLLWRICGLLPFIRLITVMVA